MKRIFIYVGIVAVLSIGLMIILRDGGDDTPQTAMQDSPSSSGDFSSKDPSSSQWDAPPMKDDMSDGMKDDMSDDMPMKDDMKDSMSMKDDMKDSMSMKDDMKDSMSMKDDMKDSMSMKDDMKDSMPMKNDMMEGSMKDEMSDPFAKPKESVFGQDMFDTPAPQPAGGKKNPSLPLHRDVSISQSSDGELLLKFEKSVEFKNYEEPTVSMGGKTLSLRGDDNYWVVNLGNLENSSPASDLLIRWGNSVQNMIILSSKNPYSTLILDLSSGGKSYLLTRLPQEGTVFWDSITYPPRGVIFSGRSPKLEKVSMVIAGGLVVASTYADEWGHWEIELKDALPAGSYIVDFTVGRTSLRRVIDIISRQQVGIWVPTSSSTRLVALDNGRKWFVGQKISDNAFYTVYYKEQSMMTTR